MLGVSLWTGNDTQSGLYTIFPDGLAQREDSYATMGSGSPYAEYLLQRIWREEMPFSMALRLSVHAVEEAKTIDPNCGGETRMIILTKGVAVQMPAIDLQTVAAQLAARDQTIKRMWRLAVMDPQALEEVQVEMEKAKKEEPQPGAEEPKLTVPTLIEEAVQREQKAEEKKPE